MNFTKLKKSASIPVDLHRRLIGLCDSYAFTLFADGSPCRLYLPEISPDIATTPVSNQTPATSSSIGSGNTDSGEHGFSSIDYVGKQAGRNNVILKQKFTKYPILLSWYLFFRLTDTESHRVFIDIKHVAKTLNITEQCVLDNLKLLQLNKIIMHYKPLEDRGYIVNLGFLAHNMYSPLTKGGHGYVTMDKEYFISCANNPVLDDLRAYTLRVVVEWHARFKTLYRLDSTKPDGSEETDVVVACKNKHTLELTFHVTTKAKKEFSLRKLFPACYTINQIKAIFTNKKMTSDSYSYWQDINAYNKVVDLQYKDGKDFVTLLNEEYDKGRLFLQAAIKKINNSFKSEFKNCKTKRIPLELTAAEEIEIAKLYVSFDAIYIETALEVAARKTAFLHNQVSEIKSKAAFIIQLVKNYFDAGYITS